MKPRITLVTLGVDDLECAVRFYRDGLGLQTEGICWEARLARAITGWPLNVSAAISDFSLAAIALFAACATKRD
jgi:catechol 2,3-dioxygenase-like lactoylglutathione lyase family enzyme